VLGIVGASVLITLVARGLHLHTRVANLFLQVSLCAGVCGLVGYLYYGLGLPGSHFLEDVTPGLRGLLIGFGCGLLPVLAVVWLPRRRDRGR
jgi:hypothetical protein